MPRQKIEKCQWHFVSARTTGRCAGFMPGFATSRLMGAEIVILTVEGDDGLAADVVPIRRGVSQTMLRTRPRGPAVLAWTMSFWTTMLGRRTSPGFFATCMAICVVRSFSYAIAFPPTDQPSVACRTTVLRGFKLSGFRHTQPELDPVENVWNQSKYGELANIVPNDIDELHKTLDHMLETYRHEPNRLHSFFQAAGLVV